MLLVVATEHTHAPLDVPPDEVLSHPTLPPFKTPVVTTGTDTLEVVSAAKMRRVSFTLLLLTTIKWSLYRPVQAIPAPLAVSNTHLRAQPFESSTPSDSATQPNASVEAARAGWIFNTIVDAGRQWNAGVHHNGASIMLARIPRGTLLYHGSSSPHAVKDAEWLAFEPEHALNFARPRPPRMPKRPNITSHLGHQYDSKAKPQDEAPSGEKKETQSTIPTERQQHQVQAEQLVFGPRALVQGERDPKVQPFKRGHKPTDSQGGMHEPEPPQVEYGYLHTYRTQQDLAVLYVDGMSAGKTSYGTTGTQDYLLLDLLPGEEPGNHSMMYEMWRKDGLCDLYATAAARGPNTLRIAGTVRAEAGFELILCDFEKDVGPPDRVLPIPHIPPHPHPPFRGAGAPGGPPQQEKMGNSWVGAVALRYDGIGVDRFQLSWEDNHWWTAYTYDVPLFNGPLVPQGNSSASHIVPRVDHLTVSQVGALHSAVQTWIKSLHHEEIEKKATLDRFSEAAGSGRFFVSAEQAGREEPIDWQVIADQVVKRYADPLRWLASELRSKDEMQAEIQRLLTPFIGMSRKLTHHHLEQGKDYQEASPGEEKRELAYWCVAQVVPPRILQDADTMSTKAGKAVHRVSTMICSTLLQLQYELSLPSNPYIQNEVSSWEAQVPSQEQEEEVEIALRKGNRALSQPVEQWQQQFAQRKLHDLVRWLDWAAFKKCSPGCPLHQICVIPMWPDGSEQDWLSPTCKSVQDPFPRERGSLERSYWGPFL